MTRAILGGLLILTGLPVFGETPEECLERGRKLLHKGQRVEGMKVLSKAVEGFRASLSKNPADARSQFLMGKTFFYMEKDKEALEAFSKARRIDPEDPETCFYTGLVHMYGGDSGKAEKEFDISLGSYKLTDSIARESGYLKEGERLFHLDGYYAGGEHRTFAFFKNEPEYDRVREKVVLILQGKLRAQSGMKPGKKD